MKHFKSLFISITALLFTGTILSADSLTVQLTGVGPNDGYYYVLPYQLSINGVQTDAVCYDFFDEISLNQTWTATGLTLNEAANGGQFSYMNNALSGYEEAGWLSSLWFSESLTVQDQIDLQHLIWNVFAPGSFSFPEDDAFVDSVQAAEAGGIASLTFADYQFLEANDGSHAQAFVLYRPTGNVISPAAPEPDSVLLLSIGLSLLGISGICGLAPAGRAYAGKRMYAYTVPFEYARVSGNRV